ncbi:MAG: 3'-5' exonuclease [Candidatus Paceibacteria bacterium]
MTKQTLKAETQRNRLRRLLQISRRWDTLPYLQAYDQLQLYLSFLEQDTMDSEDNRIHLMTIHAAKGLEFPIVFIAGLEEGLLPFISEDKSSNPDEERRLLYVAMSRAEDYLYLSYASNRTIYGTTKQRRPSRFLTSIPPAYFTYSQTGFTNTQKESSANSSSSQSSLF